MLSKKSDGGGQLWQQVEKLLQQTSSRFPQTPLKPDNVEAITAAWTAIAQETSFQQLSEAVTEACKTARFLPTEADIREHLGARPDREAELDADKAWEFVTSYVRHHGSDGHEYIPERGGSSRCQECPRSGQCSSCRQKDRCALCRDNEGWVYTTRWSKVYNRDIECVKRCDCLQATVIAAPVIPNRVEYALKQIGTSVRNGLQRIQETESKRAGRLREEFCKAFVRGGLRVMQFDNKQQAGASE